METAAHIQGGMTVQIERNREGPIIARPLWHFLRAVLEVAGSRTDLAAAPGTAGSDNRRSL